MITTWRDLGLPYPQAPGYGCDIDLSLIFTPFDSEFRRSQRQGSETNFSHTLVFHLTLAQLRLAEKLLTTRGYVGFAIKLLNQVGCSLPTGLRLTDKYSVSTIGFDYYSLSIAAEEVSTCEIYAAVFDDLAFPALPTYEFPSLSDLADEWGVLGSPWLDLLEAP